MFGMQLYDSLRNLVSGLGTGKDPTTASHYHLCLLDRNQLEQAYRANWVARRVIDAIPEDATREWREWQAAQPQIEKIEALEKTFDIQRKMRLGLIRARLYGGAALLLGVDGSGNPDEPLDYDRLGKDCLRFVVVLNRYELNAGPRIYDAESPWYTRPEYYTIATPMSNVVEGTTTNGTGNGASPYLSGMVKIHPSRVVEFTGNELPDWRLAPLGGGWGDSVLQTLDETLKDFGLTQGGIAAMVNDAKVDIIKIPGLAEKLSTNANTQKLFERFTYANVGKSTLNALLIDSDEEWDRKQTSFAALPDVLQQYMVLASAGAGIPVSRLMGSSPGKGLSTTGGGESDLRNYYDDCSSKQKTVYGPAMAPLDNVLQISALGRIDPHIHYTWAPLYQPDPKQVSDIALSKAQATKLDVDMGLINEDALRRARINQLVEDGTYPGLDDAIDEFGEEPDEPEVTPEDVQAHIGMMQQSAGQLQKIGGFAQQSALPAPKPKGVVKDALPAFLSSSRELREDMRRLTDATPRTLYVRRQVMNAATIVRWAKANGFVTTLPVDQMHVTIAYSKTPVDWMKASEDYSYNDDDGFYTVPASSIRMVDMFGPQQDTAVLLFNSPRLSRRHEDFKAIGAAWDWPDYQPHVTITSSVPSTLDVSKVVPYRGPIVLGPEIFEEVTSHWQSTFSEDGR